jgi:hypothetical protein
LIDVEELRRRCQELLHQLRFRLHAARREYHELDAAVVRNGSPLGKARQRPRIMK